jgi:hypothetical protein
MTYGFPARDFSHLLPPAPEGERRKHWEEAIRRAQLLPEFRLSETFRPGWPYTESPTMICPYCSGLHDRLLCPRVKAFEFDPTGNVIQRVEFHPPAGAPVDQRLADRGRDPAVHGRAAGAAGEALMAADPLDALAAANPDYEFSTHTFDCGWQLGVGLRLRDGADRGRAFKVKLHQQWTFDERGPLSARQELADRLVLEVPALTKPERT